MEYANLRAVLKELADEVGQNYADTLQRNGHPTTQNTLGLSALDPALHHVEVESYGLSVSLDLPSYWKYVEHGTTPHWPPAAAIDKWIQIKPVIPRPGRDGRIPSPASLSFLIRRKIAEVGTEGTNDLANARDRTLPWWYERIKAALLDDVQEELGDVILKVGGGQTIISADL